MLNQLTKNLLEKIDIYAKLSIMTPRWLGRLAQLVEHLPYKEGVTGSNPVSSTITPLGAISSVGRAPPLQGGGHWFESSIAHQYLFIQKNVLI
jgi:hypothetical protein